MTTSAERLHGLWRRVPRRWHKPLSTAYLAVRLWVAQDAAGLGAAIAFYSMFALAPLLVIAIAVAGAVFGPDAARGQIVGQIQGLVGNAAAQSIEQMIASAWRSGGGWVATAAAVVTLLVGASGVFAELRKALNRIGRVLPAASALTAYVRARLVAIALVLGFGFLLIASLVVSAVVSAFSAHLARMMPVLAGVLSATDFVVSIGVLTVAFAAFLRWLPDRAPAWRSVWVGAVTSSLLFGIGKHLIGLYLGRVSVADSFGAAGSFAIVMLWIYYSAQILLLGAAVTWALEGVELVEPGQLAEHIDAAEEVQKAQVPGAAKAQADAAKGAAPLAAGG